MKKLLALALCTLVAISASAQKKTTPTSWIDKALEAKQAVLATQKAGLPYISSIKKKGDAASIVAVELGGLKELVLVTEPTADGTHSDHALWGGAVLTKKNGEQVWLDQMPVKYKKIEGGWYTVNKNFSGDPLAIGSKKFDHGVIEHASGIMVLDISTADFAKFESAIGIDNGASASGSAIFKVLATSGRNEAAALLNSTPELKEQMLPYLGTTLDVWLTTPGSAIELAAAREVVLKLDNQSYFLSEIKQIEAIKERKTQLNAYLDMIAKAHNVLNLQNERKWINQRAVGDAFLDFCTNKVYDRAKWQPKYDEFVHIVGSNNDFAGIYSLQPSAIEALSRAVKLKRELMLSNPAIDFDKIIVTRYRLGDRARTVDASAMGTQPNNWSAQLSAYRGERDGEIVELNIKNSTPAERVIYKPKNGEVITDVQLHWNADKMMFTSNDKNRHWQVFEIGTDGQNFKQITSVPQSDLEFFDACYLPNGKIIVNSNLGYHGVPCVNGADAIGNFALLDPATGDLRRICFDQENNWHPTVMNNGRVMYTRWEYTDLMHYYSRIVFHMNPDGTEQKALYGSGSYFPNSTFDMQPLPGHTSAFVGVISGHHGVVRAGRLMIFDPERSRKEEKAMVQEIPYRDRAIIPLVKDELVSGVWPEFIKPHPIDDKYFLVTAKLSPESLWGIYLVDVHDNVTLIAQAEGEGFINPIPLRVKTTPPVIPERVDTTKKEATVFIQDIYEGEGLPGVPRGTVKKLRVMTYEFAYINTLSDHLAQGIQSGWDIKRELGLVDVEPDGSAIFTVPANTPIALQPLDEQGRSIQLMRSWFTGMPGETVSCVGCHEDQNMIAMPRRVAASKKKPSAITPPEGGVRPFTFDLEIQPILDRNCIACHNGQGRTPLNFTAGRQDSVTDWAGTRSFSKSYLAFHPYFYRQGPEAEMYVLNPYEYATMNSEMFQILENNHHGVKLTDTEMRTLYQWLDFNVPYNSSFAANPYKTQTGETFDQKVRRIELATMYAKTPVDWQKEIEDYAAVLKAKGPIEPIIPAAQSQASAQQIKVKGWPFTAEKAAEMVAGRDAKIVDLGGGVQLKFVYIPAGTYIAGGSGHSQTQARHKVVIKNGFYMTQNELTNEQLRALVPTHNSRYVGQFWKDHTTPGYNVDSAALVASKVSYREAEQAAAKLSAMTSLNVKIPTEQQWEWAARAGSDNDFWFGTINDDFSTYENLADSQLTKMAVQGIDPSPMSHSDTWYPYLNYIPKDETVDDGHMLVARPAQYKPNPWGLYDINGNVGEWTSSDFERSSAPSMVMADKVVRGGSWYERSSRATVAIRRNFLPWQAPWNVGLRLIIEP